MALFIFAGLGAFKLNGWLSMLCSLIGLILANPALILSSEKLRWALVITFFVLTLLFFPDLQQLKHSEG